MEMKEWMLQAEVQYFNRKLSGAIEQKMLGCPNKILYDALSYIRDTGGKRLRPIICLLSAEAVGGSRDKAIFTAIAIELLHNASLVHDDIIDENYIRRKNPSNPARYGEKKAIVIGDFLFGLSCEMLARCGVPEVVGLVSSAVSDIAMGQYLEFSLRLQNLKEVTEHSYMEVAALKTAAIFMASAASGAMLGCGSEEEIENLRNYGKNLGMAFQIQDDILDVCGDPAKTGKPVGLDIKNGERTILLIHALTHSNPAESEYLRDVLSRKRIDRADVDRVKDIFIHGGSINYAIRLSNDLVMGAKRSIEGLEESEAKEKLDFIADFAAERLEKEALASFIQK
jgi:geranylgeranyl diphosphate synthase type I